jgi:hypothetical protein
LERFCFFLIGSVLVLSFWFPSRWQQSPAGLLGPDPDGPDKAQQFTCESFSDPILSGKRRIASGLSAIRKLQVMKVPYCRFYGNPSVCRICPTSQLALVARQLPEKANTGQDAIHRIMESRYVCVCRHERMAGRSESRHIGRSKPPRQV